MRYICQICGYVYDEAKEKVLFSELPDSWKCPICGAEKADFKPEEKKAETNKTVKSVPEAELKELSVGQLAALCSNLSKGCEKQYKTEESELFGKLSEYFSSIAPQENDPTVDAIAKELQSDIDSYENIRAVADENSDRGAERVCVWGEKVTRMLFSLVNRYINEGEAMLEGTSIWVCGTCGFIYIGDNPPELCPVCKVPYWKFEKIEGRE